MTNLVFSFISILLGLGPDEPIAERPKKIPSFPAGIKFSKIVCGGLHTLALTNEGQVFSWGCNDDGALGRTGSESEPHLVEGLKIAMSDICAGDSHSVAYNKELSTIYLWGLYRNTRHGNFMEAIKTPQIIGEFEFRKKPIQKVVCGAHHTLFLVGGHVSAVGDPENHNLGRLVLDRHKREKRVGLQIERVTRDKQKCLDIFAGSYHSFCVKDDGKLYAWGLNNYGQLGIGDYENTQIMQEVKEIDGKNVKMIVGGESHTVALMNNGEVYTWGRNDEGQLGYEMEKSKETKENKPAPIIPPAFKFPPAITKNADSEIISQPAAPQNAASNVPAVIPPAQTVIPPAQPTIPTEQQKPEEIKKQLSYSGADLVKIDSTIQENKPVAKTPEELMAQMTDKDTVPKDCSPIPKKLATLSNIIKISAGTNFTYALALDHNLYSWYFFLYNLTFQGEWVKIQYYAMQKMKMSSFLIKSQQNA